MAMKELSKPGVMAPFREDRPRL